MSYQDVATESLDRTQDSQAALTEDADDTEFIKPASTIGSAVFKVRFQVSTFDYLVLTYFNLKAPQNCAACALQSTAAENLAEGGSRCGRGRTWNR
jgi:hypothetical protein